MSDFNRQNDEAPDFEPSRPLHYRSGATMIQQRGVPVRPALLMMMETEMEPGERLLWTGVPRRWQNPAAELSLCFAVGTPFIAMGVACFILFNWHSIVVSLMALPMFAMGLAVYAWPFCEARKNYNTIYALTDRRALILTAGRRLSVQSFHPDDVGALLRTESPDGTGHLTFGGRDNSAIERQSGVRKSGFYGIPSVRAVEKLARTILKDQPGRNRADDAL